MPDSVSEAKFAAVIIELCSKLAVVLWDGLTSSGSAFSKHLWQVALLAIDLHGAAGLAEV